MIELLLYSNLSCADAKAFLGKVRRHEDLEPQVKIELIETMKEATPDCPWDAND